MSKFRLQRFNFPYIKIFRQLADYSRAVSIEIYTQTQINKTIINLIKNFLQNPALNPQLNVFTIPRSI